MDKIKILLVEDHVLLRESLRQYLERDPNIEIIGEAGDGEEMVAAASELKPDLIIADITMPKLNGIEAIKKLKDLGISIPVLILTAYSLDQYVFPLLEAGAAGYLLKDISGQELIDSIYRVLRGDDVLHPTVMRKVLQRFRNANKGQQSSSFDALTDREIEVLSLAVRGKTNKDIASDLTVSVRTVEAHLCHTFNKLGVSSRTEALFLAFKEGWVGLEEYNEQ